MSKSSVWLMCTALSAVLAGCATNSNNQMNPQPGSTGAALYPGVDDHHFAITTKSQQTQRWFDQGVQLMYGFNHGEAIRSFKEAAARDPEAAMPWWGVAYASGMHINNPVMTEQQWKAGHDAAQHALSKLDNESDVEKALVHAVAARYTWPAPADQATYDQAYADAMTDVYAQFPDHPDVAVLYAESLMDLQPWDYWTEDKQPKGDMTTIVAAIERTLAAYPRHPQACHLYIHAMEAGPSPRKAEAAADRLRDHAPQVGHLIHMPSHLYARVGRYADAVDSNVLAVQADHDYFQYGTDPGFYWLYHAHNIHFLAFAAMMEGRYEPAMQAARELENSIPEEYLSELAWIIEGIMPTTYHVMIRFGKWEDVLREPLPAEDRLVSRAVHYYARGIALSALGRTDEARREIEKFEQAADRIPDDWWILNNKVSDVLPIARAMLEGELAYREGRLDDAWSALRRGIAAEDKLIYDEPPAWMLPVRHAMGALLMAAGEYQEAERLYREDQIAHPGNGWSLVGLKQSLEAQGRFAEASEIEPKLAMAWKRVADRPTSSCMCEPQPLAISQGG